MQVVVSLTTALLLVPFSLFAVLAADNHGLFNKANVEIASQVKRTPLKRGKPKKLIVTAYYKPDKRQRVFLTGSYRREVRLNGRGKTASGKPVQIGFAAADPRVLPIGTVLSVPGYGRVVVEDTGGAIKGRRLDVFVGSGDKGRRKAAAWGIKRLTVTVIQLGRGQEV